jgi:hypothetical protein
MFSKVFVSYGTQELLRTEVQAETYSHMANVGEYGGRIGECDQSRSSRAVKYRLSRPLACQDLGFWLLRRE